MACFLALFLVLNFLSPALSAPSDGSSPKKGEKMKAKKVFGDIFKNLKTIAKENLSQSSPEEKSTDKVEKPLPAVKKDSTPATPTKGQPLKPLTGEAEPPAPEPRPVPALSKPSAVEGQNLPAPNSLPPPAIKTGTPQVSPPSGIKGAVKGDESPGGSQLAEPLNDTAPAEEGVKSSEISADIRSIMGSFEYDPTKKKDPFENPTPKKAQESKGIIIIPKTPPEEYDLSEIELKGVIWNTHNQAKALFKLPGSAGFYTLQAGDRVGKKGVIFKIRESEVVIVETNYLGSGEQRKAERIIKIKKINRVGVDT